MGTREMPRAPCGHPGELVIGSFVRCLMSGCGGAFPAVTSTSWRTPTSVHEATGHAVCRALVMGFGKLFCHCGAWKVPSSVDVWKTGAPHPGGCPHPPGAEHRLPCRTFPSQGVIVCHPCGSTLWPGSGWVPHHVHWSDVTFDPDQPVGDLWCLETGCYASFDTASSLWRLD